MQNNGAGLNTCCKDAVSKRWPGTTPTTTEWSLSSAKLGTTSSWSLSSQCRSDVLAIFVHNSNIQTIVLAFLRHMMKISGSNEASLLLLC
jgi:hypothetical protein